MISEEKLKELDQILKKDFRKNLKRKELVEVGNALLNFFKLLGEIYREELKNKNYDGENNKNQHS